MLTTHTFQIDTTNPLHVLALIDFMSRIAFAKEEEEGGHVDLSQIIKKPTEATEKVAEKPVDKPTEKAVEKVAEKPVDKPAEKEHDGMKISEVRAMLQEKVSIGDNREKIFDKLRELNAESITTLEPKHYKAIYDYMTTL